jgi:quinol monooxygenase YgiN
MSHVITVELRIDPAHADAFEQAVCDNARASLANEAGCRVFDVCRDGAAPTRFFLYEWYDDEAAFKAHLASDHFERFDAQVRPWVVDKSVEAWRRIGP